MKFRQISLLTGALMCTLCSCGNSQSQTSASVAASEPAQIQVPVFDADSAYHYVAAQMAFGNRIPNSEPHKQTAQWLASEMRRHGAEVTVQEAMVSAYDNTTLYAKNIIASFGVEKAKRVLLLAHWDSRPVADHDPDQNNWRKPVPGANDGASGVGVLLEIARQLNRQSPLIGIDILLVDAEDYGTPAFHNGDYMEDSWALGTQYWARRPHKPGYTARYGILLDMVGGKNPTFPRESFSNYYAAPIVDKIWSAASRLGYGDYFVNVEGGAINDDHYYVNRMMSIPCVDIIHLDKDSDTGFYPYWHTVDDTLDKIDPNTLKMVGQTVLEVIYNEK